VVLSASKVIRHQRAVSAGDGDRPRKWRSDLAAAGVYLGFALFVTARLWRDLAHRRVEINSDHSQFIWFLRHAVRVVTQGVDPFYTHLINAPDGVNLMTNTAALGLTIPMVPVTMLLGPEVSFVVLLMLGLAGTAFGWYYVFSRHLVESARSFSIAAAVGGGFCGFAPGMISHANGHVNWTAQFLVPFIVLATLRLRTWKDGIPLGLLVAYQAFINEEVLLYTALALAVFLAAYGRLTRARFRAVLPGLAVAAVIAGLLLVYPLYRQFFGGQTYRGLPETVAHFRADLASYPAFSRLSFGGMSTSSRLAWNISEENTFLGWPLLLVVIGMIIWLWKSALVKAMAITAGVFFVLSLGANLMVGRRGTGIPLPWLVLEKVPLLGHVLVVRFALVLIPIVGALLALTVSLIQPLPDVRVRRLAWAGLIAALLPILPVPIPVHSWPTTPSFITGGAWHAWVPAGMAMVAVPVPSEEFPGAMEWQRSASDFKLASGYFLGPGGENGRARFGAPPRPTATLIREVYRSGKVPVVTAQMQTDLRNDVAYWNAAALVLPDASLRVLELTALIDQLAGPGWHVEDVTVWNVRDLRVTG
jgi:hypothetical protein